MKMLLSACAVVLLLPVSAAAQLQPDFAIHAHIDLPREFALVPRAQPLVIHGWAFECRSGLQPSTQRVGDIAVRFVSVQNQRVSFTPKVGSVTLLNTFRPDVGLAFGFACQSVGSAAGYALIVTDLPPRGSWHLEVLIDTFDGRGRVITNLQHRRIVVVEP